MLRSLPRPQRPRHLTPRRGDSPHRCCCYPLRPVPVRPGGRRLLAPRSPGLAHSGVRYRDSHPTPRRRARRRDPPRNPRAAIAATGKRAAFLRHLTEVEITGDHEAKWELDRKAGSADPRTITLAQNGVGEDWQVYRRTGRVSPSAAATSGGARSEYEIAVAVPKKTDANPDARCACSFRPTSEYPAAS